MSSSKKKQKLSDEQLDEQIKDFFLSTYDDVLYDRPETCECGATKKSGRLYYYCSHPDPEKIKLIFCSGCMKTSIRTSITKDKEGYAYVHRFNYHYIFDRAMREFPNGNTSLLLYIHNLEAYFKRCGVTPMVSDILARKAPHLRNVDMKLEGLKFCINLCEKELGFNYLDLVSLRLESV